MTGKPHFYKTYGYWSCRVDGFSGCGWSMREAFESAVRHMVWYMRIKGDITVT